MILSTDLDFNLTKFGNCTIESNCLKNGSYNWTYYYNHLYSMYATFAALQPPEYFAVTEITMAIFGILLNIFHGIALINISNQWKTHTKLIASLAVAGLIIAALHLIQHVCAFPTVVSFGEFIEVSVIQLLLSFVYSTAQSAQMLTMLGFSVNLFIATKMPLHYERLMSQRRGSALVCCFWVVTGLIFGLIYLLIKILLIMPSFLQDMLGVCFIIGIIILASTVSAIVLIVLYSLVFCEIYKLKRRSPRSILLRKSALTFLTILLTYILFMMPGTWMSAFELYQLLKHQINIFQIIYHIDIKTLYKLNAALSCLYVLNSVCDPFIYVVRVSEIRDSYKNIFKRIGISPRCNFDREATLSHNY